MRQIQLAGAAALAILLGATAAHAGKPGGGTGTICYDDDGNVIDCDSGIGSGTGGGSGTGSGGSGSPSNPTSTIDFTGVSGPHFTTYSENGYNLVATSGTFTTTTHGAGDTGGAIFVNGPLTAGYTPGPANLFEITSVDGGLFTVDNLQAVRGIEQFDANSTITIMGYINGVLSGTATLNSKYDGWFVPIDTRLTTAFDKVVIDLETDSSSVAIDNIVLTAVPAAVPEPASWALMVGGFGLVGGALRRRRRASAAAA
jgi:hypothetical protein